MTPIHMLIASRNMFTDIGYLSSAPTESSYGDWPFSWIWSISKPRNKSFSLDRSRSIAHSGDQS